jgi:tetratricopeptide (TPR) repeat protein
MLPLRASLCRLGFASLALLSMGCAGQVTHQQLSLLNEGESAYSRRDYALAVDKLTRFLGEVKSAPETARARYVRGLSHAQSGRRADAYRDLLSAVTSEGDQETMWRAQLTLGTMNFEDRNWQRALGHLKAAEYRMPNGPPRDTALWWMGLCYERVGQWPLAREQFEELSRMYASSSYAAPARRRLALNATSFSIQCGAFAAEKNASQLASRITQGGVAARVVRDPASSGRFLVLAGAYRTYQEAEDQLGRLRGFAPDAVIWP